MSYSPIRSRVCRRTGGRYMCRQDNTWGYNELTRTCYKVPQYKQPCGFFDGQKGCHDFCTLQKHP
ncbi:uncharacterized protein [Drosophila tropicalis]|uniref:uncharacterized protein n=1 Tax=Drosophila tropicalis TaxID=46794 RepID=UPI0035AB8C92